MQPTIAIDRLGGCGGHFEVALHHQIAAEAELPDLVRSDGFPGARVDDLDLRLWQRLAERVCAIRRRIVKPRLRHARRSLSLPENNRKRHAEREFHTPDQFR